MSQTSNVGFRVSIVNDPDAESPREWDNLGEMICFHRRYSLGDRHDFHDGDEFRRSLGKGDIVLPLYLYDHSGITMSTTSDTFRSFDSHGWDWGCVGWIVARAEAVREEWKVKRISPKLRQRVISLLRNEVDVYDKFLTGDTWGYEIADEDGSFLDSCYGFYGREDAESAAKDTLVSLGGVA